MEMKMNKRKEKSWSNMEYSIGWITQMVWASLWHVITILKSRACAELPQVSLSWLSLGYIQETSERFNLAMQHRALSPLPPSAPGDAVGQAISGFSQISGMASTQSFLAAFKVTQLFSKSQVQNSNLQVASAFHHRHDLVLNFLTWQWIFGPCQDMCVDVLYSPEDAKEPWLWSLVGAVRSLVDRFGNGGDWDSESSFDYADYFGGPPSTNIAFLTKPGLQSTMLKQNAQVVELAQDVILQWLGTGGNQSQETRKALRSQAVSSWVTRSMITGTILMCIPHGATLLLVDSVWFANAHAKARVFPQILVTSHHGVSQKLWTKFVQDLCKSPICDLGSEEQTVLQELEATSVSAAAMLGIPDL
jgi:hypothetical protein